MGHFPFFMEIEGKKGVIVGGGKVAARKVEKLLAFDPELTVIAPQIEECRRMRRPLFFFGSGNCGWRIWKERIM